MRSRGMRIHLSFPLASIFVSNLQTPRYIIVVFCNKHMSTFNINASILILFYMQFMLLGVISEQILDILHIDLDEAAPDKILLLLAVWIDHLENMLKCSRHYSSLLVRVRVPNHCVSLSTSCLSISENCCFKLSLTYHYSPLWLLLPC